MLCAALLSHYTTDARVALAAYKTVHLHFKILLFTFKAMDGIAPLYIQDLVQVKSQGAYNLRPSRPASLDAPSLRTKVTLGDRASQVTVPKLWNSLPSELRFINNIDIFKHHLKTYLYKVALFNFYLVLIF